MVFMTPDGLELDRFKGFYGPDRFLTSARLLVGAAQDGDALAARVAGDESTNPNPGGVSSQLLLLVAWGEELTSHQIIAALCATVITIVFFFLPAHPP